MQNTQLNYIAGGGGGGGGCDAGAGAVRPGVMHVGEAPRLQAD